ncbi:MAG: MaoC/PaaZ C-terminal domain-containing protein [Burkholderiaceae bacterium]
MSIIENRPYNELKIGDSASLNRTLSEEDIKVFAIMSGDVNPAHLDEEYAANSQFKKVIAHGMWSGNLISTVLGTMLPGPGTIYLNQSLRFVRPVTVGDTVTVTVTIAEMQDEKHRLKLDCLVINQHGEKVVTGAAEVIAPTEKISRQRVALPEIRLVDKA